MAHKQHSYTLNIVWTGNLGQGTSSYRTYARNHEISAPNKLMIPGSSDPAFRGDGTRYNPEELLVASASTCHMLWYLHLCADAGISVMQYTDAPVGMMVETENGGGHFTEIILRPTVMVKAGADLAQAHELHDQAHHLCYIANSVNFPIRCDASIFIFHPTLEL
ncbi:MAG: OsmC family protein [Chloroflexota bacterium]